MCVFSCFIVFVTAQCMLSYLVGYISRALVPFCPAQFSVTHCLYLSIIFEQINDDDDDLAISGN